MRNLKRALCLALAAVMLIGMMVVSAGAVSYDEFSDKDEIVNKDAVAMLVTLGVIAGKGNDTFDPAGAVTRQEMAKMLSVVMNKGVDNNALFQGLNTKLTDLSQAGDWARGHINFCYSQNIIAGRGDGRFDPLAQVTAVEAAKMLLVAVGYNPETEGMVGAEWSIKTSALASKLGIFDNFDKPINAPLNRDDAALLIYNALDVEMIESYSSNGYPLNFADRRTILSFMYGVYKVEGVVVGNKWAELDGTDSDAALKDGKTVLDDVKLYASTTTSTDKTEAISYGNNVSFNVNTTVDMLGKTVTLYVKKTTILADSTVLGVASKDNVNVVEGTADNKDTLKKFLKGTGLTETSDTEYYVNYGYYKNADSAIDAINATTDKFNVNGVQVEVIDNNNDGDVDYVLFLQETLSTVTKYNAKAEQITVTGCNENTKGVAQAMSFDDVVFEDEVVADDLVLFVEYGGRAYLSAPEIVTGKISRVDRDAQNEQYITVDGDKYYQSYIPNEVDPTVADPFDITNAKEKPGFDEEVSFILDSTGHVVAFQQEAATKNYALVLSSAWTQNALTRSGQVTILMTDGTKKTYDINWKASVGDKKAFVNDLALETYLGTRDVVDGTGVDAAEGTVITYSISDDDMLTIKSVLKTDSGKYAVIDSKNAITAPFEKIEDDVDTKYDNGDARLYVKDKGNSPAIKYAVDLNTIAFYYDYDAAKDKQTYGVATGYDKMRDVVAGADNAQVYTVKDGGTLVEIVLFNSAVATRPTDVLFVLSANAINSKTLELNVVLDDGTATTIEVDKDTYLDDFDEASDFNTAWYYSALTGDITLEKVAIESGDNDRNLGLAHLLKKGTIVVNTDPNTDNDLGSYFTVTSKSKIWDVTDMDDSSAKAAPATEFLYNTVKNAFIVYDDETNTVLTAWVWDYEEGSDSYKPVIDQSIKVDTTKLESDNEIHISLPGGATLSLSEKLAAVKDAVAEQFHIDADKVSVSIKSGKWTIEAENIFTAVDVDVIEHSSDIGTANKDAYVNALDGSGITNADLFIALAKSGLVTYDYELVVTGSNALTVNIDKPITFSKDTKNVPAYTTGDNTIGGTYGGSHSNSDNYAIIALFDTGASAGVDPTMFILVGDQDSTLTRTFNGTTVTINVNF